MNWYFYIIFLIFGIQLTIFMMVYHNYRFNLNKYQRQRPSKGPKTALCIPCKGIDCDFERNITSFFQQEYNNYILRFVVEDSDDPAYEKLCELKDKFRSASKASDIEILIAGRNMSGNCSQKNHNLLYCCAGVMDKVEALAFADSDICVSTDWLSHLVYPLRQQKNGVSSGYRWFIPKNNITPELALSALNAKVAQLLGNTRFNQVWGGAMAIRTEVFTASYEGINWKGLFEFGRRQFLITRVSAGSTWLTGLLGAILSVFGPIITAGIAIYSSQRSTFQLSYIIHSVPPLLFGMQFLEALLRQNMIRQMLCEYREKMKKASVFDLMLFWPMSCLLLLIIITSAFGRTIRWRGIRYKLLGPAETLMLD